MDQNIEYKTYSQRAYMDENGVIHYIDEHPVEDTQAEK